MTTALAPTPATTAIDDRLREVLDLHLDPRHGSAFWLERAARLGIDIRGEIRTMDELLRLGTMSPADLIDRPLRDFVPRALHHEWHHLIVAQTGGTTSSGAWTAYRDDEFEEAFIDPFAVAADHVGFPRGGDWLYVGPSGPHIIGKVVRSLARSMNSADPFSVDFDPRWAKRLPPASLAFARYLDHVAQQAMDVIAQQAIAVIFTTPIVLARLAQAMTVTQRQAIRGVHYGGMALSPDELMHFQATAYPRAIHLSGYGNTLFGCCMEIMAGPGRSLDYYPFGERLVFETLDADGRPSSSGRAGQVCFTRLDRSMLILRMRERDEAELLPPPSNAPDGFRGRGVRNPHSPRALAPDQRPGLY